MRKQRLNKATGKVSLTYKVDKSSRQSCTFYHCQPLKVLFPQMHYLNTPSAVLINTAGGVVGGDTYNTRITLKTGSQALITTQAAEKIYGSRNVHMVTNIHTHIETFEGSWLEWVPQETIIFNEAQLKRNTTIYASPGSEIMAGEILVFGRTSRGEQFQKGNLRDKWKIYWGKELLWQDTLVLREKETLEALSRPVGFNGATAYCTFVYVNSNAPNCLEKARQFLQACETRSYATTFDNLLLVRFLSSNTLQLREDYGKFWEYWRNKIADLPSVLPKIWYI